ncbi:MAG TPA: hypothetical protein QF624_01255 [Dehalococcoidia bacterium]|nr:hypothetical protein [Dehalococcoidia bacterium]
MRSTAYRLALLVVVPLALLASACAAHIAESEVTPTPDLAEIRSMLRIQKWAWLIEYGEGCVLLGTPEWAAGQESIGNTSC